MPKRKLNEAERDAARKEFYRIVEQRLDARLERGESYTSTKDLYKGYEGLHDDGFADTQFIAASVSQVLDRAKYRDRLWYARHVVSGRAERTGPGKSAPYKIYLRQDATPPKDFVLVPYSAKGKTEIAEYIAHAKGVADASVHVTQLKPRPIMASGEPTADKAEAVGSAVTVDFVSVATRLVGVVKEQAELINELVETVDILVATSSATVESDSQVEEAEASL